MADIDLFPVPVAGADIDAVDLEELSRRLTRGAPDLDEGRVWISPNSLGGRKIVTTRGADSPLVVEDDGFAWEGTLTEQVIMARFTNSISGAQLSAGWIREGKFHLTYRENENGACHYGELFYGITGAAEGREDFERRRAQKLIANQLESQLEPPDSAAHADKLERAARDLRRHHAHADKLERVARDLREIEREQRDIVWQHHEKARIQNPAKYIEPWELELMRWHMPVWKGEPRSE